MDCKAVRLDETSTIEEDKENNKLLFEILKFSKEEPDLFLWDGINKAFKKVINQ